MDEAFARRRRPTIDPHSMNPAVIGPEKVDHFQTYLKSVAGNWGVLVLAACLLI